MPKPRLRRTAPFLTFRLWAGAVLILNPCQLPEDEAAGRDWVRLNVGGALFDAPRAVLLGERDTFFAGLLGSGAWEPNAKGQYEIDRSPRYFPHVLDFLRHGQLDIWAMSEEQIRELQGELDFYAITSQAKAAAVHFEAAPGDAFALRLSLARTSVRCVLCTADVRLVLPPDIHSGSVLVSFTLAGSNADFLLYSGADFGRDPFFANFYVPHPNARLLPPLPRYVIKVAHRQVSFVKIGNPPAEKPRGFYAVKVTGPISDAALPLCGDRLYFRLWAGVQVDLVRV